MNKPNKNFQFEIRLGLSIIVLVLLILNFASHYTLFRIQNSVQAEINEKLIESAVIISSSLKSNRMQIVDSTLSRYRYEYTLSNLIVVPLDYNRSLSIMNGIEPELELSALHTDIKIDDLIPLLKNESVIVHEKGSQDNLLLFPFDYHGVKNFLAIEKKSSLLSSIEQAGTVLLFAGIIGLGIIVYASYKFVHFVIYPYKRLREQAEKSGRYIENDANDVNNLINSYESIIADLKRQEGELKGRIDMVMEMSGGLAHQLRNSIGGIVGFTRLIKKKVTGDEITNQNIAFLLDESKEAEILVNRFMDFARPLNIQPEHFSLNDLLFSIKNCYEKKYPRALILLPEKDISIWGDNILLKQALANIIGNACHAFGADPGTVQISVSQKGESPQIAIQDDGPGISDSVIDNIFTPFVSGSPSGTGLGLSLAQKIIDAHSGTIRFESSPQTGTIFYLLIPAKSIKPQVFSKSMKI